MKNWTCNRHRRRLGAYLDDELSQRARGVLRRHLQECASCRSELAALQRLQPALTASEAPPVPPELAAGILAAARDHKIRRPEPVTSPLSWWRLAPARLQVAAVGMLIIGLALGLLMGTASAPSYLPSATVAQSDPLDVYQVEYLTELPSESLAGGYLALVSIPNLGGR